MSFYMRAAASLALEKLGAATKETTLDKLAAYKGRHLDFIEQEIGYSLTDAQKQMLDECNTLALPRQHCICSATGFGKSFFLACYVVARFLVDGAQIGSHGRPEGFLAIWLGPDEKTLEDNIWRKIIGIRNRLIENGWTLPGEFYERSLKWEMDRENWFMRVSTPPRTSGGKEEGAIAGNLLGRHHENMIVAFEEGAHIRAEQINSAVGMLTGERNILLGAMNPTYARGPVYAGVNRGSFTSSHFSAFDHPNVIHRKEIIEGGGTGHAKVEARIRFECHDLGPAESVTVDKGNYEFVYALPPAGVEDTGNTRSDGILGHKDGEPRVYRPRPEAEGKFCGQVLGVFPSQTQFGIFNMRSITACQSSWDAGHIATLGPPDRVGIDPSRAGKDHYIAVPSWGPQIRLLRDLWSSLGADPKAERIKHRTYFGNAWRLPKSSDLDFLQMADRIIAKYGTSPIYQVDAGYGSSIIDSLRRRGCTVHEVHFAGKPAPPLPGMDMPDYNRAAMFFELAWAVNAELCWLPPSSALAEELSFLEKTFSDRAPQLSSRVKNAEKVTVHGLIGKDEIRALLGRSPDEADATALAFYTVPTGTNRGARGGGKAWGPDGSFA